MVHSAPLFRIREPLFSIRETGEALDVLGRSHGRIRWRGGLSGRAQNSSLSVVVQVRGWLSKSQHRARMTTGLRKPSTHGR